MPFSNLTIERSRGRGRAKKTRSFSVRLLGYMTADAFWDSGSGEGVRPAFLTYVGTDSETRAFTANFRSGYEAKAERESFQILRRAAYRWSTQKVTDGQITTVYLPELFDLEPVGPAGGRLRFVFAPPRWWIESQREALAPEFGGQADEVARAALFAAYLDRRTPLPVLGELGFHLALYQAALDTEWVTSPRPSRGATYNYGPLFAQGAEACGFDQVLAVSADQATVSEFLTEQTSQYRLQEALHG